MQQSPEINEPDNTAVRTALWRALHMQIDAKPSIIEDPWGLKLVAPPPDWTERPDMKFTKRIRASIVARARFIEDLVTEEAAKGTGQYMMLGAGLDTFAQRRADIASGMQLFEIDQPGTLLWKQQRLNALGWNIPDNLHFVPVDFEISSWWEELIKAGFDQQKPAVLCCTGVLLYLTKEAIRSTLETFRKLAPGSKVAITYNLPLESLEEEDKPLIQMAIKGARDSGTPMISFFNPEEIQDLARQVGLKDVKTVSTAEMRSQYFQGRPDDLIPATGEDFLVITR